MDDAGKNTPPQPENATTFTLPRHIFPGCSTDKWEADWDIYAGRRKALKNQMVIEIRTPFEVGAKLQHFSAMESAAPPSP